MIAPLVKFGAAAAAAVATYVFDQIIKERTGKHVHEHLAEHISRFWSNNRELILAWTDKHPAISKIARFYIAKLDTFTTRVMIFAQWKAQSGVMKRETIVAETTMSMEEYNRLLSNKDEADITDKVAVYV